MKTNKLYIFSALLGIMLVGCQKEEAFQPEEKPQADNGWTLTLQTVDTKALSLSGKALNASWKKGEKVAVYYGATKLGDLAVTSEDDASPATLSATNLTMPSELKTAGTGTLFLLSPGRTSNDWTYIGQDGSAPGGALDQFSYATTTVNVTEINEGTKTITATITAAFANQQSVYRFGFKVGGAGDPIAVSSFTVSSSQNKLVKSRSYSNSAWEPTYGSLTVTSSSAPAGNLYYMSLCNENTTADDTFTFLVVGDAVYTGTKVIPQDKLGNDKFLAPSVPVTLKTFTPSSTEVSVAL